MSYKERLSGMSQQADEANSDYKPGGNFAPVPDNDYLAKVKATLDETKKEPKRLQVTWVFVISEGDLEGRQIYDRTIIEDNKVGMQICRQRVEELGYQWPEPEEFENLEAIVEDITNRAPSLTIRTKASQSEGKDGKIYDNVRVYVREVHEMPEQAPEDQGTDNQAAPADDDDDDDKKGLTADELHQKLLDFCASQGLEGVTDAMGTKEIIDGMVEGELTFLGPTLDQEEVDMLTAAGGANLIKWKQETAKKATPAPIKKEAQVPAKKAVAPAPTKKPVLVKKGKK